MMIDAGAPSKYPNMAIFIIFKLISPISSVVKQRNGHRLERIRQWQRTNRFSTALQAVLLCDLISKQFQAMCKREQTKAHEMPSYRVFPSGTSPTEAKICKVWNKLFSQTRSFHQSL